MFSRKGLKKNNPILEHNFGLRLFFHFFFSDLSFVKQRYLSLLFALILVSEFRISLAEPAGENPEPRTTEREGKSKFL